MSSSRTAVSTRQEVLKKQRRHLDKLSTREAQVLRMRYGLSEPGSAKVGRPVASLKAAHQQKIDELEAEILDKIRTDEPPSTKQKIVDVLKNRS